MKNVFTIFKREFKSYFDSPVAYVFLTAFLALVGFLTFAVARFYEMRNEMARRYMKEQGVDESRLVITTGAPVGKKEPTGSAVSSEMRIE